MKIIIRQPNANDMVNFTEAMITSQHIHKTWVNPPKTAKEYLLYLEKFGNEQNHSFIVTKEDQPNIICGVINLSQIVRGLFQNAFISYYATTHGAGQGIMSQAIQLVIKHAFDTLNLHRIEANIQPNNLASKNFIQKNGFTYEGLSKKYLFINNEWCDHEHYVLINHNWVNNI